MQQLIISCLIFLFVINLSNSTKRADKLYKIQTIYNQLFQANGNYLYPQPILEISPSEKKMAAFYSRSNRIVLEEKAYKVCESFGDDMDEALAFILAHELAHSFDRDKSSLTATSFKEFDHVINGDIRVERAADVHGIFNAYLAGYKTYKILPELIERLYEAYGVNEDDFTKYPPKEIRIRTAQEVIEEVDKLVQIYEGANYLAAIGQYKLAAASFEYLESVYKGREIYNNLAVNYALHAMNFTDEDVDILLYPLELDWDSRIKKPKTLLGDKDLNAEEQKYRFKFLDKARKNLEIAQKMDKMYIRSTINMISVLNLLGEYGQAIEYYERQDSIVERNGLAFSDQSKKLMDLAIAITFAKLDTDTSRKRAKLIWKKYQKDNNQIIAYQANYNLRMLENEKCDPLKSFMCIQPINTNQIIDNVTFNEIKVHKNTLLNHREKIKLGIRSKTNSTIYQYEQSINKPFTLQRIYQHSNSNFSLNKNYLLNSIALSNGYFIVCSEEEVVFRFNNTGQLVEWAKFTTN